MNIENSNPSYQTPYEDIFKAAIKGTIDDVKYFIDELGIDVNAGNKEVWEPPRMTGASTYSNYHRCGYDVCCVDFSPLHMAVAHNNIDIIKYLISIGANVNARNRGVIENEYYGSKGSDGWTPLHMAAINNHNTEVIEYLISQGADIKTRNTYGATLLHVAAHYNNSIEVLKYLISQGLDVDATNSNCMTPLHYAAFYNHDIEILKYLISQDSSVKNRWNETLLHMAAFSNPNVEIVKYLVSQGFDVKAESNYGDTPLDLSRKNPNDEIMSYLESLQTDEIESAYDYVGEFHEGLARVRKGMKWGYIDKTENIVIPLIYKIAYNFENGVAIVSKTIVDHGYNYSHGYINRNGHVLTDFVYEEFELSCCEGLIRMSEMNYRSHKQFWGFIDTNGEKVIPFIYDSVSDFHEGLASVIKEGKIGFIDKMGNEVIPFMYDGAFEFQYHNQRFDFHEGMVRVIKDGKWGFIDKNGNVVIPYIYDDMHDFSEGTAKAKRDGKWWRIDKSGNLEECTND